MSKVNIRRVPISEIDLEELKLSNRDFEKLFFEKEERIYKIEGNIKKEKNVLSKILLL